MIMMISFSIVKIQLLLDVSQAGSFSSIEFSSLSPSSMTALELASPYRRRICIFSSIHLASAQALKWWSKLDQSIRRIDLRTPRVVRLGTTTVGRRYAPARDVTSCVYKVCRMVVMYPFHHQTELELQSGLATYCDCSRFFVLRQVPCD